MPITMLQTRNIAVHLCPECPKLPRMGRFLEHCEQAERVEGLVAHGVDVARAEGLERVN